MRVHDAAPAAARRPNWLSLPEGVLQHIIGRASTWKIPGSCSASSVCRTWRAAAAGCSGTRLLYNAGCGASDESFATWLCSGSRQLGSLILSSSKHGTTEHILGALALAAESAAAAGHPLQLHTLRVLGCGPSVATTGRLLAALPHLRCLHLPDVGSLEHGKPLEDATQLQQQLAPLQQATQLLDLQLADPLGVGFEYDQQLLADLLPLNLQRLSWHMTHEAILLPFMTQLKQLTSLQLVGWSAWEGTYCLQDCELPAALRELDLGGVADPLNVPQEQLQRVSAVKLVTEPVVPQVGSMSNLRSLTVAYWALDSTVWSVAAQLTSLSAVTIQGSDHDISSCTSIDSVAGLQSLKRFEVQFEECVAAVEGLFRMTQLTRLAVSLQYGRYTFVEHHQRWGHGVGQLQGLKWLTMPDQQLLVPDLSWLGSLTQLQVLHVELHTGGFGSFTQQHSYVAPYDEVREAGESRLQQCLQRGSLCAVPPQLRLLMVTGVPGNTAGSYQLRRRLKQQLVEAGKGGCEVLVGLCDPTKCLAGVPEDLLKLLP